MMRYLLAAALVLAGGASILQMQGTFAGVTDVEQAGGAFEAQIEQTGPHDPGHPYEDVDNDDRFTNGTDVAVDPAMVTDGRYTVSNPGHGLVVPRSVGPIETDDGIDLAAGDEGHLVVEVKLEAARGISLSAGADATLTDLVAEAGGPIEIDAGGFVDVEGAHAEAGDGVRVAGGGIRAVDATLAGTGAIELVARDGSALVNAASIETDASLTIQGDQDARLDDAHVEAGNAIEVTAGGDVYVKRAKLETSGPARLEAGSQTASVYVEGGRFLDDNDTAQAAPVGVQIVGTPAEGSVDYQG